MLVLILYDVKMCSTLRLSTELFVSFWMLTVFVFCAGLYVPGAEEVVLQAVHHIDEEERIVPTLLDQLPTNDSPSVHIAHNDSPIHYHPYYYPCYHYVLYYFYLAQIGY